jgi:hypothetical protein
MIYVVVVCEWWIAERFYVQYKNKVYVLFFQVLVLYYIESFGNVTRLADWQETLSRCEFAHVFLDIGFAER